MLLEHKRIVVIGGTSGIGLAAAKYFCNQGASVVSLGKKENIPEGEDISTENHHKIFSDATLETSAEAAIKSCQDLFGGFDGLLHVAGGSGRNFGDGSLHEMSLDGWEKTITLNATTVMLSNKAAINSFLNNGVTGAIVNISSVLATNPAPHFFTTHAYAASKAAIIGLSKSAASFYAKNNIRINVISPGLIESPMSKRAAENETIMEYIKTKQPLDGGRIGQPDDISGMAALLLSNQSSFITGQNILVDGGWSISEGQY